MDLEMTAEQTLSAAGITLPMEVGSAANYEPYVRHGDTVYISGQIPRVADAVTAVGKVGQEVGIQDAQKAARVCALRLLALLRQAAGGSLNRVAMALELTVYVNSAATFTDQSLVADAASELFVQVLGPSGRHARAAVGVAQLPKNAAVEIKGIFALLPEKD
jgi:enamine deaminase RidA (YjgF/YER057c/UK114 family)